MHYNTHFPLFIYDNHHLSFLMNSFRDSQIPDINETHKPESRLRRQIVIDLLAYYLKDIIGTDKMAEPVLVSGRAQTGKSVLFNALCDVKFDFNSNSGSLEPLSELVTPIGDT